MELVTEHLILREFRADDWLAVLAKVGMQLEGRQRDKERFKRRWWDPLLDAILEDEWRARHG
jgi:RimJ/RimL family protein N-acetyltransferase